MPTSSSTPANSPAVYVAPAPPSSSIGTQADFVRRLRSVLPAGWFPQSAPVLDGVLNGIASIWSSLWGLLVYVSAQKRIATATDINLDMIAADFLGPNLPRRPNEYDSSYRARIRASIFQEMGTRAAISATLTALTGGEPAIFEPANARDTGGYGARGSAVDTGLYYGKAGGYGSYKLPFQAFVGTSLTAAATISGVQGYGFASGYNKVVIGGYGAGALEYASGEAQSVSAADADIYAAINAVKPVGTIIWVTTEKTALQPIVNGSGAALDTSFILDISRLASSSS